MTFGSFPGEGDVSTLDNKTLSFFIFHSRFFDGDGSGTDLIILSRAAPYEAAFSPPEPSRHGTPADWRPS